MKLLQGDASRREISPSSAFAGGEGVSIRHMLPLSHSLLLGLSAAISQASPAPAAPDLINADRPGIADGSNVVGKGRLQVELGVQWENHDADGVKDRLVAIPALLRYGVNEAWELRIETSGAFAHEEVDGQNFDGYQPTSVGAKYHFMEGSGTKRPSLGAIARIFPASGSSAFASDRTQFDFRLAADWDLKPGSVWSVNPNIGIASYDAGDGSSFTAGLFATTLSFNPTPKVSYFVDTGVQTPEEKHGKTQMIVDGGAAVILGSNLQLDLSTGTGVLGYGAPRPFVGAGVSVRF